MEASVDRIARPRGSRTPYGRHEPWPARVDTYLEEGVNPAMVQRWVQAASIAHSDGDAMDIAVVDGRMVGVRGRRPTGSTVVGWGPRTSSAGRRTPHRTV